MHKISGLVPLSWLVVAIILVSTIASAAVPRDGDSWEYIKLKTGDVIASEKSISDIEQILIDAKNQDEYVILRLSNIPTYSTRQTLESFGLKLLDYIPYRAWIADVSDVPPSNEIQNAGIVWAGPYTSEYRIYDTLATGNFDSWAVAPDGDLWATIAFHSEVDSATAITDLQSISIFDSNFISLIGTATVEFEPAILDDLIGLKTVQWIDQVQAPIGNVMDRVRPEIGADIIHEIPYGLKGSGVNVLVLESKRSASTVFPPGLFGCRTVTSTGVGARNSSTPKEAWGEDGRG